MMNEFSFSFIVSIGLFYLLQLNLQSSRQSRTIRLSAAHTFTDYVAELVENFTLEADVTGWITDVTIMYNPDDWTDEVGAGVMVTASDDWGEISDINPIHKELMGGWAASDRSASMMAQSVPKFFFTPDRVQLADNSEYREERRYNLYEFVKAGENINIHFFLHDLDNTPTTGGVNWVIKFVFVIACFAHKNRGASIRGSEVVILARMDDTSGHVFWTPPCSGRIGNQRLTVWGDMSGPDDYVYFGEQIFTDEQVDTNAMRFSGNGLYVHTPLVVGADILPNLGATNYTSKLIFLKKAEMVHLEFQQTDTEEVFILLEFSFVPDFDKQVDFNIRWEINNLITDTTILKTFQIPFDMYLEKADIEGRVNDPVEGEIYLMGLKDVAEILTTSVVLGGSILGPSGVQHQQSSVLPSNILETVVLDLGNTLFKSDDPDVDIYDYYPAGSLIMLVIDIEVSASTEDMDIILNLTGKSRVKSSRFGTNYFSSPVMFNLEAVE